MLNPSLFPHTSRAPQPRAVGVFVVLLVGAARTMAPVSPRKVTGLASETLGSRASTSRGASAGGDGSIKLGGSRTNAMKTAMERARLSQGMSEKSNVRS